MDNVGQSIRSGKTGKWDRCNRKTNRQFNTLKAERGLASLIFCRFVGLMH